MADLTKTIAAVADLSAAADRLIALNATNAQALADAQNVIASADDTTSASVAAITAKIDAVAPAPTVTVADTPTVALG